MKVSSDESLKFTRAMFDVARERNRQDAKWGVQNYPDGTRRFHYNGLRDDLTRTTEQHAKDGTLTWKDILAEEVYEAFCEDEDPEKLRAELVQVAAVAVAWIECIDRKQGNKP